MKDIILVTMQGIGDVIVCTPTIRALREKFKDSNIIIYTYYDYHFEVLKHNPHITSLRRLKYVSLLKHPRHLFAYLFNRHMVEHTLLDFHHVDLYEHIYTKNVKEIVPQLFDFPLSVGNCEIYLTQDEDQKAKQFLSKYHVPVIMHTKANASQNNNWERSKWEEVVSALPEMTFIQVGKGDEPHVKGTLDLRGRTALREAFALIKHAVSFVGVNSGFSHATNAFGKNGVIVFGSTSPVIWGHANNINIWGKTPCSPCFTYLVGAPCPYDKECMKLITVDQVCAALKRQVERATAEAQR